MSNQSIRTVALVAAVLVTLSAGLASAQELRGRIVGTVTDNTGAVLPGATVTVSGPALIQPQTTTSGPDGIYRFPALPSGVYTLTFAMSGFQTLRREEIRALLNTTLTVDVQLKLAGVQETVTITGESPTVDTKTTSIGTNFTKELLVDIPNARDVWAAMSQAPGFQMTGYDVGGSHTGTQTGYLTYGVGDQNKTMLEGINVTEATNANAGYFDFGSFEEFQLGGAGNMGEMAGPGGFLNITTKSGGDKFSGMVYFDYENSDTISDNVPSAFRSPGALGPDGFRAPTILNPETKQNEGLSRGNPITKQYDFNVGFGGPIIKGKLWFYAGYRDNNQYKTILGLPGEEAQSQLVNYTGKVTYQINPKNQVIAFWNQRTKLQPLRDLSLAIPLETAYWQGSKNRPMKLEWTSVLSDRLYLDLQLSQWYNAFPLFPSQTKTESTEGVPVGRLDLVTNQKSGANNAYQNQIRHKPQFSGSLSYFKDGWAGNHSFKGGWEIYRDRREFLSFQPGNIYYRDRNGVPSEVDIWNSPTNGINDCKLYAGYIQDGWSVNRRLTLNLGVRVDHYEVGWPEQNATPAQSAFFQPINAPATTVAKFTSPSPRVGFAYDLTGNGKTVWKTFFGRFYFNPSPDTFNVANPVGRAQRRYQFNDLNGNRILDGPQELGRFLADVGGAGFVRIDPEIKHAYGQEISTHLEREVVENLSVRGSYVFKMLRDQWDEVDALRVNAYTIPFTFVDTGADNRAGTADDQTLQLFDRPATVGQDRVFSQPERFGAPADDGNYHTVEFAINRRFKNKWMLLTSFEHTWTRDFRDTDSGTGSLAVVRQGGSYLWQPNRRRLGKQTTTFWNYKLLGRYEFPWQIAVAGSYKLQSGFNWARTVSVPFPNAGSETIFAEPVNSNRAPNVHIIDFRAEKAVKIGRFGRVTGMLDVFNALNADTITNFRVTSGTRYKELIALLDPRIVRFGVRYEF
ncbi:MAG TPA: TonB-dependent receptor [Vicinamibacteria bacterium]|nr:TonB-dependent receptor [Vicinamibacteria bacterium]